MSVKKITADNFQKVVMESPVPVLLDFWATWCGPCRMLSPVIEQIAAERPDVVVGKVNVDEEYELAKQFRVISIPTVLVTRFHKSPAAKLANVVLRCGSNEGPFQFGSVPARVAQLTVLDVLFQEYCYRNQASCEENIRRIASALAGKHV